MPETTILLATIYGILCCTSLDCVKIPAETIRRIKPNSIKRAITEGMKPLLLFKNKISTSRDAPPILHMTTFYVRAFAIEL